MPPLYLYAKNRITSNVGIAVKPIVIPSTCLVIALVIFGAARSVIRLLENQQQLRTDSYLAIKTQDLDIGSFEEHYRQNYPIYSSGPIDLQEEIQRVLTEYPEGRLFHYNTSEKAWKNLGGRKGYAIVNDGRIVWDLALARS